MELLEILLISIGVAMDAFAVSICKGLAMNKIDIKKMCIVGGYFGTFQALMPVIGYYLGKGFEEFVTHIDHWIAFILLAFIGINMFREAFNKDEEEESNTDDISIKTMLILAIATSIDALAVGITFAFLEVKIFLPVVMIGVITFITSCIGVLIGNKFGDKYRGKAEIFGGVILICIGVKILIEHLFM